jgi:hypothetical protein
MDREKTLLPWIFTLRRVFDAGLSVRVKHAAARCIACGWLVRA